MAVERPPLDPIKLWIGFAGLLPQILACLLAMTSGEWRWVALAGGWAYAALIFSFLGGIWWGIALRDPSLPAWVPVIAVLPSLIGLMSFLPWTLGNDWPAPALAMIGTFILLSPIVDWFLGRIIVTPPGWLRLRIMLSVGLGSLTILLALLARLA